MSDKNLRMRCVLSNFSKKYTNTDISNIPVTYLVDFNVPLAISLPFCQLILPDKALRGTYSLEHFQNTRHHTLETTEVHMGSLVHTLKNLLRIFLYFVLDIHLTTFLVPC